MEAILWESGICPYPVVGIKERKLKLMYQHREKPCSLILLMTSFAMRH